MACLDPAADRRVSLRLLKSQTRNNGPGFRPQETEVKRKKSLQYPKTNKT